VRGNKLERALKGQKAKSEYWIALRYSSRGGEI
jgi:hypothetical protein